MIDVTELLRIFMYLYHFTDWKNMASIEEHGLLCWPLLDEMGIRYRPSSSEGSRYLDRRRNLHHYVRLSPHKNHPMAWRCIYDGRIQRIAWLRINTDVIDLKSTLFSDDNATAHRATIGPDSSLALNSDSRQAEVMVKNCLDSRWISFP